MLSRSALPGFPLGDVEKDFMLNLFKKLSKIYFVKIVGFCIMGNHFHLVVKTFPGEYFSDEEVMERFTICYGEDNRILPGQVGYYRDKWSSLSEFVKEFKQTFSWFYNKRHSRKGFFWSERFKSVLVEEGPTLINCLAYIDLNPIRAGIVKRPEDYRWSSLGYYVQTGNKDHCP
ncbi:transposase [Desulfovulcanus sp.]